MELLYNLQSCAYRTPSRTRAHLLYFLWSSSERDGGASPVETTGEALVLLGRSLGIHVGPAHALNVGFGSDLVDGLWVNAKQNSQYTYAHTHATCILKLIDTRIAHKCTLEGEIFKIFKIMQLTFTNP